MIGAIVLPITSPVSGLANVACNVWELVCTGESVSVMVSSVGTIVSNSSML